MAQVHCMFVAVSWGLLACQSSERIAANKDAATVDAHTVDTVVGPPRLGRTNWATRFDFDGDRVTDPVEVRYSGGGHCCYTLSVALSKFHRAIAIPFELDGGYVGGLDLSNPSRFDVEVGNDGVAKLHMLLVEIPRSWVRRYGIEGHEIRVDLRSGAIQVENVL